MIEFRFELVFEILFAEKVQSILAHSAKKRVKHTGGEYAIDCIEQGADEGEHSQQPAAAPAFSEALSVPGEKSDGANG